MPAEGDVVPGKFSDPFRTARGEDRASVPFLRLKTLWANTGTLCNIECAHCYIRSSPTNDSLAYLGAREFIPFLDEALALGAEEIGFTGGEPFMNPEIGALLEESLARGFRVLVLSNAMKPMMRPRVRAMLEDLLARHGARLCLRVSLDHYTSRLHDAERGDGAFEEALGGLDWLAARGFRLAVASRRTFTESEDDARRGYAALFAERAIPVDPTDPSALVLFPEMDESADTPEITTACWSILKMDPAAVMCATSRMIVKRKGADAPVVLACTLIADDPRFEFGARLADSLTPVRLNHPHCSRFCVLGGARCST